MHEKALRRLAACDGGAVISSRTAILTLIGIPLRSTVGWYTVGSYPQSRYRTAWLRLRGSESGEDDDCLHLDAWPDIAVLSVDGRLLILTCECLVGCT